MRGMITVADAAQMHVQGKVNALGAFWTSTRAGTLQSNLIIVLRLDRQGELGEHQWLARLVRKDVDGEIVTESAGSFSVEAEESAELPKDAVPPAGAFTFRHKPVELNPGLYAWELHCDDQLLDEWEFSVLSASDEGKQSATEPRQKPKKKPAAKP